MLFFGLAPRVGMTVELQQRDRAVALGMCLENRISHEVITAKGQCPGSTFNHFRDVRLDLVRHTLGLAPVEAHVAVIDNPQETGRVEAPAPWRTLPGKRRRRRPDRPRPETCAGAVGDGKVIGHTRDDHVRTGDVLGIWPAQEAESTCERVVVMHPKRRRARKCTVSQVVVGHLSSPLSKGPCRDGRQPPARDALRRRQPSERFCVSRSAISLRRTWARRGPADRAPRPP